MDGYVVHTWESGFAPGAGLYLLDNGNLLRSGRDPEVTSFRAGGVGGLINARGKAAFGRPGCRGPMAEETHVAPPSRVAATRIVDDTKV